MIRSTVRTFSQGVRVAALAATALVGLSAGVARAEDAPADTSFVKFSGSVALVSDYRYRGVSLSNTDGAIQGSLNANTTTGFFVSMWGSSIANYGGSTTEVDVYGGWTGTFGPVTPTIGIYSYLYPGGHDVDIYEIYGTVGFTFGPVGFLTGINYAPSQGNFAYGDNVYVYLQPSIGVPGFPVTVKGSVGYEDGAISRGNGTGDNVWDWMVGVDFKYKMLTLGVQYIGNSCHCDESYNRSNLKDTALVSLTASF
jgi:uncharacterized protein (TIGR02001 family)